MPDTVPPPALARVGRALLARSADPGAADGRLLGRFAETGDTEAFAGLVARHGPMVYAVCRRAAGDAHLADDAFQATFLILARRARDVRPREAVRAFLYGVAVRTARTARARADRRLRREAPVSPVPDRPAPAPPEADPDALRILDEEIARLPDRLRAAVVLCELDGLSRKDAAARLGVPEGTVSSRLAAARKALAARLRARGVTAPAAGLGVCFAELARAGAVPRRLAEVTARLATLDAAPPGVTELTQGVFKTMLLSKLTAAVAGVALLAGGLVAAGFANPVPPDKSAARRPSVPAAGRAPVPKPQPPREGVIAVTSWNTDRPVELFKPDGTPLPAPAAGGVTCRSAPRLSPDGKRLASLRFADPDPVLLVNFSSSRGTCPVVLDLGPADGSKEVVLSGVSDACAAWSPDGTKLYGSQVDPGEAGGAADDGMSTAFVSWVYDPAIETKTPLAVPTGHAIADVCPDGKTLLTVTFDRSDPVRSAKTYLVPLATFKPRLLTETAFRGWQFSPDGTSVLGFGLRAKAGAPASGLVVVSVADGARREVKLPAAAADAYYARWSPDGKRVAYHWLEEIPQPPGTPAPVGPGPHTWRAGRVTVADADGGNPKVIVRREYGGDVTGLDWR